MKRFARPSDHQCRLSALVVTLVLIGGMASAKTPTAPEPEAEKVEPMGLMGDWCYIKKRRVTRYNVEEGKLVIVSGRSGQRHTADITCNDTYTECEAQTIRGWGTPVTEIMRFDEGKMQLTRIWGGSWKDKTYNFTYTRCPKM